MTSSSAPSALFSKDAPVIERRGVHLDLKGLPPTPKRLLSLLDLLAAAHYNVILVEWEDMFPWTVDERFRNETCYTPSDVKQFSEKAAQLGIEIIPLVQCLGHMETPLSIEDYKHMREVPDRPDGMNPLAEGARELILGMVNDVLALLPDIRHFHLGGDEAWTFGTHPDTKAYIEEHGRGALYLHHVEPILQHLNSKGIRPILWHDMMVHWEPEALDRIKAQADLCVWGYQGHPANANPKTHYHISYIERFREFDVPMWGAPAYKGADGNDSELPNLERRMVNVKAWTEVADSFDMKGVLVTAWSRYNTKITQVEPIDACLDALVLSGSMLYDGDLPANAAELVMQFLDEHGEGERFRECRDAVAELAHLKEAAWNTIRLVRQNVACAKLDAARGGGSFFERNRNSMDNFVRRLDENEERLSKAFAGLIPDVWVRRFAKDRGDAIRGESVDIAALMNQVGF